jgi:methionine-rich copper-binding protein CopC
VNNELPIRAGMRARTTAAAISALALLLGAVTGGSAHAVLERAEPRAGSTVRTAPAEVRLWFTENLEPAFSTIQVLDARGQRVDRADGHVDTATSWLLRVSLPPLAAGAYRVTWRVVSVDMHVTQGDFTFAIAP